MDAPIKSPGSEDLTSLPIEAKAAVLSGRNFWQTEALPEAGVRGLWLSDGPYGLRHQSGRQDNLALFESDPATCFPPAVAIGSSWDVSVAARLGEAVGREAAAQGVDVVLGPGINIKRSPLCGRNFEYYSEDPRLSGELGSAFTRGLQSEGPGVSVKHFAANNQETDRQTISSDVDERTLREIYLPAFEQVVTEAKPATVMSSYNKINGVFASENPWLLTDLLRKEWGFEGVVVSDWSAVTDRVAALKAGLDLEMPGSPEHDAQVVAAVAEGLVDEELVDDSIRRIAALGDRVVADGRKIDLEAHHDVAREIALECPILLRNEHAVLPIPAGAQIAVIGAFAEEPRYQGGGSAHVNATRVDQPLAELRSLVEERGGSVTYAAGFAIEGTADDDSTLQDAAVEAARRADVAVVFAGLSEREESEGIDRTSIDLPAAQVRVIRAVAAAATRTVVVLSHGGVVSLEGWHDEVDSILDALLLGQGGGRAIAELLIGLANPSGHLAETIPHRIEDHPSWLNFPGEQGHVRYGEGVLVGYRHFSTAAASVRYPFGHGLSYTTFTTGDLSVAQTGEDSVRVSVAVSNTGTRAGKHVVQAYVSTAAGPVRRPVRELRAFAKVSLEPGETTTVEFDLSRRAFAYWDIDVRDWVIAAGAYQVQICADAMTVLAESTVELTGDRVAAELKLDSTMASWMDHPDVGEQVLRTLGFADAEVPAEQLAMVRSMTMQQFIAISGLPIAPETLEEIMAATRSNGTGSTEEF